MIFPLDEILTTQIFALAPSVEALVTCYERQQGCAAEHCGLLFPRADEPEAPPPGWVEINFWFDGECSLLITELGLYQALCGYLTDLGRDELVQALCLPKLQRSKRIQLDFSTLSHPLQCRAYLTEGLQLSTLYDGRWYAFEQCINSDYLSLMPDILVINGMAEFEALLGFEAHRSFVELLTRYRARFPDRLLVLRR